MSSFDTTPEPADRADPAPAADAARDQVLVAMSGGVDSSVAALLLQQGGADLVGLFMKNGVAVPEEEAATVNHIHIDVNQPLLITTLDTNGIADE